jgi:hypothetical protein
MKHRDRNSSLYSAKLIIILICIIVLLLISTLVPLLFFKSAFS